MIKKFFNSIFSDDATSHTAFQVSKHLSDYVGMFMRLAFIALLDRLMWVMFDSGRFGPHDWFRVSMVYITSGFLWIILIASIVSIFNLTFRCVVETYDELTGFSRERYGIFWLITLLLRMGVGVIVGGYAVLLVMTTSIATQNLVEYLGSR